jgi:hypothetical protein
MQPYPHDPKQAAVGLPLARTQVEVDQGLRAFMLGVYNNMVLGSRHLGPRGPRQRGAKLRLAGRSPRFEVGVPQNAWASPR